MTTTTDNALELSAFINGEAVQSDQRLDVMNPWDGSLTGTIPMLGPEHLEAAIQAGNRGDFTLFHQLHQVLQQPFTEQVEFSDYEAAPTADEVVCETFCGT